jgi:hypothetical protein
MVGRGVVGKSLAKGALTHGNGKRAKSVSTAKTLNRGRKR